MKMLSFILAVATATLIVICVTQGRKLAEQRSQLAAAREELKQIAVQSEREGSLTSTERAMIHNVVDFRNVRAADVMVPLEKAVTVSPETSIDEALRLSAAHSIDRMPVISDDGEAIGLARGERSRERADDWTALAARMR